jgi:hypothetical protein
MAALQMGPIVLLTLLLAYVPTHATEPSILTNTLAGSEDPNHSSQGLHSGVEHLGEAPQAEIPSNAAQMAMEPLGDTVHPDGVPEPAPVADHGGVESVAVTPSPDTGIQGPEVSTEGYDRDGHARVAPPTSFTTTPSVTEYIPWSVFNSSDPIYMRAPSLIEPKVRNSSGLMRTSDLPPVVEKVTCVWFTLR